MVRDNRCRINNNHAKVLEGKKCTNNQGAIHKPRKLYKYNITLEIKQDY